MYVYVSKTNLLKKCPKANKEALDILCELKEIDIDVLGGHWVYDNFGASYSGQVIRNDDGLLFSEYLESNL
uniref:Uncharacterized protein n=1 Tax=viral metagenome TaxID=1070528 RepID=A0A6M3JIT1_9ZZZZ